MTQASRIRKLEMKLICKRPKIYWLMWNGCKWRESEGLMRNENESIDEFKRRLLKVVDRQFIWVK